jgi:outer membrane PBP1 activator LpoA protein
MQQAFQEEWRALGGVVAVHFPASTDENELQTFNRAVVRSKAEQIFLAMDSDLLKKIRPYLDPLVPTYTTSHAFSGSKGQDLSFNNIRFVDMPWLVQRESSSVIIYPRSPMVLNGEMERLYAFGIDAFRLSQEIDQRIPTSFVLDGVTGRITLGPDRQFVREAVPVMFRDGWIIPLERRIR